MDKGTAKQEVDKLVKKFLSIPKSELDNMKEEQIKFRFIEPLFEILGWERDDIFKEERVLKGRADYIRFDIPYLKLLPIKLPDEKQAKKIKELVERMMELCEKKIEQQIKNVDYEINEEIYKLYGITKEEQEIVEENSK